MKMILKTQFITGEITRNMRGVEKGRGQCAPEWPCRSRAQGFGCDCIAGGCVKRPLYIASMIGRELTLFISESVLIEFWCTISLAEAFQLNSDLSKLQHESSTTACGSIVKFDFRLDFLYYHSFLSFKSSLRSSSYSSIFSQFVSGFFCNS